MSEFTFDLQRFNTVVEVSTLEELTNALASGGEIKLTAYINLTSGLTISKNVTLDLNGKKIDGSAAGDTFVVGGDNVKDVVFTINDTSENKDGSIIAGTDDAVWIKQDCSCILTAGKIIENSSGYAPIYSSGSTFTMNGGSIESSTKGCVNVHTFNMTGGTIDCKANNAIAVNATSGSITNGTIKGDCSTNITLTGDNIFLDNVLYVGTDFTGNNEIKDAKTTYASNKVTLDDREKYYSSEEKKTLLLVLR